MKTLIPNLIKQFEEIQNGKLWMGENFEKKIGNLPETDAFTRPIPTLHSIAELLSHLTVWRKETVLKIKTGKGSMTDSDPANWRGNDQLKANGWEQLKSDYQNSLKEIIELISDKEDDFLYQEYYDTDFKGNYSFLFLLEGMIHHDVYHLGQMGIVLKLIREMNEDTKN